MRRSRIVVVFALLIAVIAGGCATKTRSRAARAKAVAAPPPPPPAMAAPPPPAARVPAPPSPVYDAEPATASPEAPPSADRSPAGTASAAVAPERRTREPRRSRAAATDAPVADDKATSPAADQGYADLKAFVDRMKSASAALRALPERLELGKRVDVRLRVSPLLSQSELRDRMQAPGAALATDAARIAPRMKAELIVPSGASVAIIGSNEQAVREDADTEWRWTVTPAAEGDLPITARLTAPVKIDDKETNYDVRTFEASVTVFVTPKTRVTNFVEKNWQWLWTTLLVPAWAWWWKRRQPASKTDPMRT